jgi:AraC-like DNA-binding protein
VVSACGRVPSALSSVFRPVSSRVSDSPLADIVKRPRPLTSLASDAAEPDPIASLALHAPSIRSLARDTGYSERHLRRRLVAATGHTPKRLGRIGRMHAMLAAGRGESRARTAVEFGYHDESHMINDIRSVAGATPHEMLNGRFLQGMATSAATMPLMEQRVSMVRALAPSRPCGARICRAGRRGRRRHRPRRGRGRRDGHARTGREAVRLLRRVRRSGRPLLGGRVGTRLEALRRWIGRPRIDTLSAPWADGPAPRANGPIPTAGGRAKQFADRRRTGVRSPHPKAYGG